MRYFLFFAFLAAFSASANAEGRDLPGSWKGTWTKGSDALAVTLKFGKAGGSYSGTFDSDALQVVGIPLTSVRDANGKVHFEIKGDQSTTVFDGAVADDAMSGTFADGADKGTFNLVRTSLTSSENRTRDVTFQDNDVTLAGTLVLPSAPGRHPAIAFLHGSGAEGRWANRYLAEKFAAQGVVALVYDKRGVGKSGGDWRKATLEALAADGVAGIRFLQSQPEVDARRVGIYGHSQGGMIAPLVGERAGDLDFIVATAAPGADPADVEEYSVGNAVGAPKLPPAERADARNYVRALVDVAYRGKDRSSLDEAAMRFKGRAWYFAPPPPEDSYWFFSRQLATFRPMDYWRRIQAPVLLVYGAHDERVPPRESAAAIQAALKSGGNGNVTLKIYSDADHTFTIVDPPPHKGAWPKYESDYSGTLVRFVLAQTSQGSATKH
jgi:pimeloyl-ACP methyl ester carboxylesterase